jgi:hypothetical protein
MSPGGHSRGLTPGTSRVGYGRSFEVLTAAGAARTAVASADPSASLMRSLGPPGA